MINNIILFLVIANIILATPILAQEKTIELLIPKNDKISDTNTEKQGWSTTQKVIIAAGVVSIVILYIVYEVRKFDKIITESYRHIRLRNENHFRNVQIVNSVDQFRKKGRN